MSWWSNLFVSRHVLFLEAEFKKLQDVHAHELAYERGLNQSLRDDIDRLRVFLNPSLQAINLHPDTTPASADRDMKEVPRGTPWQQIRAREIEADAIRWKEREDRKKRDRESGKTEAKGAN